VRWLSPPPPLCSSYSRSSNPGSDRLLEAAAGRYGVAAFNVNNLEQIQGIMEAAQETQPPVIVRASRGARSYVGDNFLHHMMRRPRPSPDIPVALHQDHGDSAG
jgi:fructose-bisphosphate aldolase class II